ncbi:hypothetical protein [Jannaschia sp. CCS1]|uniref:hypothetical protein n=1 Tax=Jannaschia sp. (strain CCS1) TaxID=290400 RepID=UPI000053A0A4|nr:hypothetical protein [Jannaschia sp. CCS1]ABD56194.1 hypothetical protein Jann_3277 [Jannaschia sp. CCS1]
MPLSALRRPDPAPPPPPVDIDTLAFLRMHWARSRCLARSDLFTCSTQALCTLACPVEARAIALLRALASADGLGGLHLYQLGTAELSFDERWLLAALTAGASGDTDSLTFLLNSRLKAPARRQVGALIMALSRGLQRPSEK